MGDDCHVDSIYCSICNKYGHTDEACTMRFQG